MSAFKLTKQSFADLSDIWIYIAKDNLDAADRLLDKFYESFGTLATMPEIGHRRKDLTSQDVLFWPIDSYLVIYKPDFRDNSWGVGIGKYQDRFRKYQTIHPELLIDHAHNDYLETAAEWGLFWRQRFGRSSSSYLFARFACSFRYTPLNSVASFSSASGRYSRSWSTA